MKKKKITPEQQLLIDLKDYFTQEVKVRKELLVCLQILNK